MATESKGFRVAVPSGEGLIAQLARLCEGNRAAKAAGYVMEASRAQRATYEMRGYTPTGDCGEYASTTLAGIPRVSSIDVRPTSFLTTVACGLQTTVTRTGRALAGVSAPSGTRMPGGRVR